MEQNEQNTKQAIRTAIQKIAGTWKHDFVEIVLAKVDAVDKIARTCDVTPITGKANTPMKGVNLMAETNDGEYKIPSVGSTIGIAMSIHVDPFVVAWSDLDEWYLVIGKTTIDVIAGTITLGDGSYGGIIKIDALKTQWDANVSAIKSAVAAALAVIDAQLVTLGQAGGSVAAFNGAASSIQNFDKTTSENQNIKHGDTNQ